MELLKGLAFILVFALAGTTAQGAEPVAADLTVAANTAPGIYYSVRQDLRKCVSPLCGGYFIKPVNRKAMRCIDGVRRSECYVAEIQWGEIGLERDPDAALVLGQHRGRVYPGFGRLGVLIPKAAWHAAGANPRPLDRTGHIKGRWFGLRDTGVVCVAAPCFNIKERYLNSTKSQLISEVNLSKVDAAPDDLEAAMYLLHNSELLAVGKNIRVPEAGPAGTGIAMVAYDFYLPVKSKRDDPLYCEVDSDCTTSAFHSLVRSPKECYCPLCPEPIGAQAAAENAASWRKYCANYNPYPVSVQDLSTTIRPEPLVCPTVACFLPIDSEVGCVKNQCAWRAIQPKISAVDVFQQRR